MIKNVGRITRWVAGEAGCIFINIPINGNVCIVRFGVGMANHTTHFRIVCRVAVAINTLAPLALVRTAVYREILAVMVESSGHPFRFRMAFDTVGRELCRYVVGVDGIVKIRLVATRALVGCVRKVTIDMTQSAFIGNI